MKKYFLKKNNKEIKVGDKVKLTKNTTTTYGIGTTVVEVTVTEETLKQLIKDGFVEVKDDEVSFEDLYSKVKPYLRRIVRKTDLSFPSACVFMGAVYDVSPVAHLQVLIETIAEVKNRGKKSGKLVYYLNPVVKFYPSAVVGNPNCATVFYSKEDAEETYKLLKPFIEDIIDEKEEQKEQKD